ncbi:carbonic anhydrase 1-like [Ornithodoros turicata]|uniref:carbonic anhydrase 1-like n=1 Tax=Ornithodoros turicata TaxID=34597 RepID=UPI00313A3D73
MAQHGSMTGPSVKIDVKEDYCEGYKWIHKKPRCLERANESSLLESTEWAYKYRRCGDSMQSPIHIHFMYSRYLPFEPMQFVGFEEATTFIIENGGNAVYMTAKDATVSVFGGPLSVRYNISKAVFHLGYQDQPGSEHRIDDNEYAAELQILLSSVKPTPTVCLDSSVGVVMMCILFKESERDNPHLKPFIDATTFIRDFRGATVEATFPMRYLMPRSAKYYYVYQGSLTFPPCTSGLPVMVFTSTVPIGKSQLDKLRSNLYISLGYCIYKMAGQLRETAALSGRPILRSFMFMDSSVVKVQHGPVQFVIVFLDVLLLIYLRTSFDVMM